MYLSLQNGRTPLMVASGGGHVECVKLLLDKGAQVNHCTVVSTILMSLVTILELVGIIRMGNSRICFYVVFNTL